jgi:hypothetical protein
MIMKNPKEYIAGIKENFIATKVKLNDLKHNVPT